MKGPKKDPNVVAIPLSLLIRVSEMREMEWVVGWRAVLVVLGEPVRSGYCYVAHSDIINMSVCFRDTVVSELQCCSYL